MLQIKEIKSSPRKCAADIAISLEHEPSMKSCEDKCTDDTKCIKDSLLKNMYFIQPTVNSKLIQAIDARQDEVFKRFHHGSVSKQQLEDNLPNM